MMHVLVAFGWVVLGPLLAVGVTLVAGRLLGTSRGWLSLVGAGLAGWTLGVLIAGVLTSWEWATADMVGLALLFGTFLTMVFAVGLDMLSPPGSLHRGAAAGRVAFRNPATVWRTAVQPFSRYRQLVGLARANGLTRRDLDAAGGARLVALGPPLRHTLEQAGGIFVKLGQVASTRSDLLPPEVCQELALLRSRAEPAPQALMRPLIEAELGGPVESVFASFDWEPIASASIAQVYGATMPDGAEVVVKVQRPGLDEVIDRDSAALLQVARVLERYTTLGLSVRPRDLVEEFVRGVTEELDFRAEAANGAALAATTPASSGVRVPKVYLDVSTERLLVEERVRGVSIADVERLRASGHDPDVLADRLLRVMLEHLFDIGTFHADPHPGNVLVDDGGTIVLIDLGSVGHLGRGQRAVMVELLSGATQGDAGMVRQALDDAGMVAPGDPAALDEALEVFLARHVGPGGRVSGSLFEDLVEMLARFGLRPPQWMATIGRTMVLLEGTLRTVDPSFALADAAHDVVRDRAHATARPSTLRTAIEGEALTQLPRLRRVPQRVDEILAQASRGRLRARVSLFAERDDIDTVTRLVNRMVLGVLAAAVGIGSVMLIDVRVGPAVSDTVTVNEVLGYIGLAIATLLTLRLVAAIVRDGLA